MKVQHSVSIVLFSRCFFEESVDSAVPNRLSADIEPDEWAVDGDGRVFRDIYKVLAPLFIHH